MRTRVSSKGQIVLPAEIRQQDRIEIGQQFEVTRVEAGEYKLRRIEDAPNQGLIDLLLNCPNKDWFEPLNRGESTADLKPHDLG